MSGIQDTIGEFEIIPQLFAGTIAGWEKILSNNPRRVAIVWGYAGNNPNVWPSDPGLGVSGIVLQTDTQLQYMLFRDFGALVCSEWYVSSAPLAVFPVIEVIWTPRE